jgi:DNA-binding NarL/FixJ family response regulator
LNILKLLRRKINARSHSEREQEVVDALVDGLSYKLIADRLSLSVDAVRSRIKNIYRKLHVNSKSEVVLKVMKGEV